MKRAGLAAAAAVGGSFAAMVAAGAVWRQRSERVNLSIPKFARYWDELAETYAFTHDARPIRWAVLGDSSSQGIGASEPERAWPHLVATWIQERTHRPVHLYNFSVSGSITSEVVRDQLPQLKELPFTPDLVTVGIGGNDAVQPQRVPELDYHEAFNTLCELLPAGSFITDPPAYATIPRLRRRAKAMAEFAREALAARGHHLLPLYDLTNRTGLITHTRHTAEDWFHPNDRGYYEWAATFFGALLESGWEASLLQETEQRTV